MSSKLGLPWWPMIFPSLNLFSVMKMRILYSKLIKNSPGCIIRLKKDPEDWQPIRCRIENVLCNETHILQLLTEIHKLEKYYHPDSQLWYCATISCGKEISDVNLSDHFTRCYSFTPGTYLLSSIACGSIRRWLLYKTSRWRGGVLSTLSIISWVVSYN